MAVPSSCFPHASRRALGRLGYLLVALVAIALARPHTALAQDGGIPLGATAPGAAVVSLDGKAVDLAQFIGKTPVVLEFWATWCPLCRQLEPAMAAARQRYGDRVAFVSVGVPSNQSAERQKAYVDEKRLGGEFVFDRDGKAMSAYQVPHTSYVVVVDQAGKVVYTGVGGDQDIVAAVAKAVGSFGGMHRMR